MIQLFRASCLLLLGFLLSSSVSADPDKPRPEEGRDADVYPYDSPIYDYPHVGGYRDDKPFSREWFYDYYHDKDDYTRGSYFDEELDYDEYYGEDYRDFEVQEPKNQNYTSPRYYGGYRELFQKGAWFYDYYDLDDTYRDRPYWIEKDLDAERYFEDSDRIDDFFDRD